MTTQAPNPRRDWLLTIVADLVCVLVFAMAGRTTHESGSSGWVVLAIVWPYAASVALAHTGLLVAGRPARRVWPEGAVVVTVTYVLGTLLRLLSGRGTAGGFLVVALLFLALSMLGWRVAVRLLRRSSSAAAGGRS